MRRQEASWRSGESTLQRRGYTLLYIWRNQPNAMAMANTIKARLRLHPDWNAHDNIIDHVGDDDECVNHADDLVELIHGVIAEPNPAESLASHLKRETFLFFGTDHNFVAPVQVQECSRGFLGQ